MVFRPCGGTGSGTRAASRRARLRPRAKARSPNARVHWGKLHFLTREQLLDRYPRAADFLALRASVDPEGVFLNDHLQPLFGLQ
ncbi:MAG TPA: D-arabinono-1,4-lactone oxidase [Gaiellaceae bacterium]|nr:D-arabinono-1,4-lactone oxidase [Gaiellaceae bacterium]